MKGQAEFASCITFEILQTLHLTGRCCREGIAAHI